VTPFFGLVRLGRRPRLLSFGFLRGYVALSIGFPLLSFALLAQVVVASDGSNSFFRLALDGLDDALDASFGSCFITARFWAPTRHSRTVTRASEPAPERDSTDG
jgi:hypothetical protein